MSKPSPTVHDRHYESDLYALLTASRAPPVELNERVVSFGRAAIIMSLESYLSANHEISKGIVSELANALRTVESGHVHPLFQPIGYGRKGTPGRELLEMQSIRTAVRYRTAVEIGNIVDRAPIKSMHEAFGGDTAIARRTVERWIGELAETVQPLPSMPSDQAKIILALAGDSYQRQHTRAARANR